MLANTEIYKKQNDNATYWLLDEELALSDHSNEDGDGTNTFYNTNTNSNTNSNSSSCSEDDDLTENDSEIQILFDDDSPYFTEDEEQDDIESCCNEEQDEDDDQYIESYEDEYNRLYGCADEYNCHFSSFGGKNTFPNFYSPFKHVQKGKFKKQKINAKRRIHHRQFKKNLEECQEKNERRSNRAYIPPPIRYADNNSYHQHQHHYNNNGPMSTEEKQIQQALTNSVSEDHHLNNFAKECGIEYSLLLALTQRDLTAEDYDILLQLDNAVQKKTVSNSILSNLPTVTLSFECKGHDDMPEVCSGDMCVTCMCDFEEGEELRWIPKCGHIFHKPCIDAWLENQSTMCPICRVEVNT